MKKCVVIYNPNSGHTLKKNKIPEYQKLIESYDYEVEFIGTEYKGHATEIVYTLENIDLVMSMGGDGTFNEIVCGNLKRKKRLLMAHIPVGTTNDVGTMFGYGKDIKRNIKLCLEGQIKKMDIPLINGRPFVYVAGVGKFLSIPYDTPRDLKKRLGHAAYIIEGLKDFFNPTKKYEVTYKVNGEEKSGFYSMILVSSANRIAGVSNFYKDIKLDDDTFEVLLCTYTKRMDIIRAMIKLLATDASKVDGFESYKTNKISFEFAKAPKKAWCIDGEGLEIVSKNYEIFNENNIEILLPKKNVSKLFIK